jgi:hypothetical protein
MRKLILAVAVALAGAGAFAAVTLGDQESSPAPAADLDRGFERVSMHRTAAPSVSVAGTAQSSAKGKPKVGYFESADFVVPAAGVDTFGMCPKKYKAITGYFGTSRGITLDYSANGIAIGKSTREWDFGLLNTTGADGQAFIGSVCAKEL